MMFRRSFAAVLAAASVCALLALAAPASAMRAIRLQPAGEIQKVVEAFTIRAFGGEVSIICKLTLTGRLANVIEKASAGLLPAGRIGQIEEGATEGCRTNFGGAAEVVILVEQGTPFSLRYQGFLGLLPNITGILFRKLGFSFKVIEPVIIGNCLYRGPVNLLLTFPPAEGGGGRRFTPEAFVTPNAIPLFAGALCPETVEISGAGRVTPPQVAILLN